MREVSQFGIEASRWTIVFHRKSKHLFFRLIAMGHFKHVSALAWIPELGIWVFYDVQFRRTRLVFMEDGEAAKAMVAAVCRGNALVTMPVRDDALPIMRAGLFCTSAIKHLIGMRSSALRPSAFFRDCLRNGGTLHGDGNVGIEEPSSPSATQAVT